MKEASVDGALIIQPGNHQYDHSYVISVLRQHPDKFVGALLANPTTVRHGLNNTSVLSQMLQQSPWNMLVTARAALYDVCVHNAGQRS